MSNLPPVPPSLIQVALQKAADLERNPTENLRGADVAKKIDEDRFKRAIDPITGDPRKGFIRGNELLASRGAPRTDLIDEFKQWVDENINEEWSQIGVSLSITEFNEQGIPSDALTPHCDRSRSYGLLYNIQQSNVDQYTVWYQEKGQGIFRRRGTQCWDYADLIELDRVCLPTHTWMFFSTSIIHSLENVDRIQGFRTSIQISFDIDPFGVFVK